MGTTTIALRAAIGQGQIRGVAGNSLTLEMIGAAIRDEGERRFATNGDERLRRACEFAGRAIECGNGPSADTNQ